MQYEINDDNESGIIYPSKEYLLYLLEKSLVINGRRVSNLSVKSFMHMFDCYNELCEYYKSIMDLRELDTFKRAACFLLAIKSCSFDLDIAIEGALFMCERPYCFVGKHNVVYKMNEVNFDSLFIEEDMLNDKIDLMNDIVEGKISCVDISNRLELWYYMASMKKGTITRECVDKNLNLKKNCM